MEIAVFMGLGYGAGGAGGQVASRHRSAGAGNHVRASFGSDKWPRATIGRLVTDILRHMMTKRTLIFPGGMSGALSYMELCVARGESVLGASSLSYDPNSSKYQAWTHLPYLMEKDFDEALDRAVGDFEVTEIFTPHPIVWRHLKGRVEDGTLGASLVNISPMEAESAPYRSAIKDSALSPLPVDACTGEKPSLSEIELASLLYHAERIYGMCDRDKTRLIIEIFRYAPRGDVVEVGSWWGKSAFILCRLSQVYGIGALLCVDPWQNENAVQADSSGLVDRYVAEIDVNEAHSIFVINMLPYAKGDVNYLRMPSQQAFSVFRENAAITSPEFGPTSYNRKISVLHIDGNHAYEHVKADIVLWTSMVTKGGWIIIDDYVWPWDDGPQRAGDEFLAEHWDNIGCSFVMGTALVVQLAEPIGRAH